MMLGKWPGEVASYDADKRTVRVKIDGVTDGAEMFPEAQFEYAFGDKSNHTEIRVLQGDLVWIEFMRGDSRYPIITGYRTRETGNVVGWRRWHHDNFETEADGEVIIKAGTKITLQVGGASVTLTADQLLNTVAQTTMTGKTTSQGLLAFQAGMTGQGGSGGGAAMQINGGAKFTEDVEAAGISTSKHSHMEQGDNAQVGPPI